MRISLLAMSSFTLLLPSSAFAASVSLASIMDGDSRLREFGVTGTHSQISFGDGSVGDADGAYDVNDPSVLFGTPLDVFPNESSFSVGSIDYDTTGVTGVGIETVSIDSITLDLTSDIANLDAIFFGAPAAFSVGMTDQLDTLTLTDSAVTSIAMETTAAFALDLSGLGAGTVTWNGSLSVAGNRLALVIDDTQPVPTPAGIVDSPLNWELNGMVTNVIPEPSSIGLLMTASLLGLRRRRS